MRIVGGPRTSATSLLHCLTVVLELVAVSRSDGSRRHREEYLLSGFALQWPSEEERDESLLSGSFEPRNVIQTKMQMWRDRVYVVQSRYKPGVPFTLGVIDLDGEGTTEPTIQPYPDYESHGPGRSRNPWKRVNNVVDAYLDAKGLLWALDNGDSDEDGAVTRNAAKAKVFAVNVRTDEIVTVIDLSSIMIANASCPQSVAVDYSRDDELYLFVSDVSTHSIVVYNEVQDRFFKTAFPRRMIGTRSRDVLNMLLVRNSKEPNNLYFTYLTSDYVYHMETSAINEAATSGILLEVGRKPCPMVFLGTDGGSVLFMRREGSNNVYAWDTNDEFKTCNFKVAHHSTDCRIPLKVAPGFKDIMWVLESNFMDYANDTTSCIGPSTKLHPMVHSVEF